MPIRRLLVAALALAALPASTGKPLHQEYKSNKASHQRSPLAHFARGGSSIQRPTDDMCSIQLAAGLCIDGGKTVLASDAKPNGIVGRWTFDDAHGLDSSGYQNHAIEAPPVGVPFGSHGASAYLNGETTVELPTGDTASAVSRRDGAYTYSFWVHPMARNASPDAGSTAEECPFVLLSDGKGQTLVAFAVDAATGSLSAKVLRRDKILDVKSRGTLPLKRWTHVAVVHREGSMHLYVNGVNNGAGTTVRPNAAKHDDSLMSWFLGRPPTTTCNSGEMFVDELTVHDHALSPAWLEAVAAPALVPFGTDAVRFGCEDCSNDSAVKYCAYPGYHLCHENELCGAMAVSRAMGWANARDDLWTTTSVHDGKPDEKRVALCCAE